MRARARVGCGRLIAMALAVTAIASSAAPANAAARRFLGEAHARRRQLGGTHRDGRAHRRPDALRHGAIGAWCAPSAIGKLVGVARSSTSGATRARRRRAGPARARVLARRDARSTSTTPTQTGDTQIDEFTMHGRVADTSTRRNRAAWSTNRSRTTTAGSSRSDRTATSTSRLGDGGAEGDDGPGHARGGNGQSLRHAARARSCGSIRAASADAAVHGPARTTRSSGHAGRPPGDLGVRTAQPVALLVRPRHRRPLDRRRRAGRVGGDRPRCATDQRPRRRARATTSGGTGSKAHTRTAASAPADAVAPVYEHLARHRRVRGDRRLRVPRHDDPRRSIGTYLFSDYCDGTIRDCSTPDGQRQVSAQDLGLDVDSGVELRRRQRRRRSTCSPVQRRSAHWSPLRDWRRQTRISASLTAG